MSDVDFQECEVIKESLCYVTFDEFCKDRKTIAKCFKELSKHGKIFYKFYVYANIHMELNYKDAIWNYLNDPIMENEIELINLNISYRPHYIR